MKIYIDANTGTWGSAEGLVMLDADPAILAFLDHASDADINAFAAGLPFWRRETNHPVCSNPDCVYHGVAASNARQDAFYQNHPRG